MLRVLTQRSAFSRVLRSIGREIHCDSQLKMTSEKLAPAKRVTELRKNLRTDYTALAMETKAVDLGHGMPYFVPPQYLTDATRSQGNPRLVTALAKMYSILMDREIDPMNEVLIASGAYSCLSHAISAFLQDGDEVILIEPFPNYYQGMAQSAGAKPKVVPLTPQKEHISSSRDWGLDLGDLKDAFSFRTKMIIINNPNNTLGKVFIREELEEVAELCKKHNVICVMDEVYEWLVYSGSEHIRLATLSDMWERTITIGSAEKMFSAKGWKMGWAVGPEHLVKHMQVVNANTGYTFVTGLQEAVGWRVEFETSRLGQHDSYFREHSEALEKKRDEMAEILRGVDLKPIIPDSGCFMLADISPLVATYNLPWMMYGFTPDRTEAGNDPEPCANQFVKWMAREKGVATIPLTAFYRPVQSPLIENFVPFCFIKEESTLQAAYEKLREWELELCIQKKFQRMTDNMFFW